MNRVIVIKCRPFRNRPARRTKCVVEYDEIRVWDHEDECYTGQHELSARDEQRIRARAAHGDE